MSSSTMPAARGAPSLDPEQLRTLREQLEEQRRFRTDQLAQLRAADAEPAADAAEHEITESLLHGSRVALREIEAALERMADGSYGACTGCGTALPPARLEVLPQLALCPDCQYADAAG
jgi:RNA polymerase-binding transcription factor DksA